MKYAAIVDPPLMDHQRTALRLSAGRKAFALLMEQGTAKTRVAIDTAGFLYENGEIDTVIVIAPNSVKANWVEEIELFLPKRIERRVFVTSAKNLKMIPLQLGETWNNLTWIVQNVESVSVKSGAEFLEGILRKHRRTLLIIDESSRIKNHRASRTKKLIKIGKLASHRRILTGTPVTRGPIDLFSQFEFLDPSILGFKNFYAFRNRYAVLGGWQGKQIVGYRNLDELTALIAPHSYRVTKKECLDLPPQVYQKRYIELSVPQELAYTQMATQMLVDLKNGEEVRANIVLTQLLRLQQIIGGWLTVDGVLHELVPISENPKIKEMIQVLDDSPGKVIVFAWFKEEIKAIHQAITDRFGPQSVAQISGDVDMDERTQARLNFQDPKSEVRFIVCQSSSGGIGINLFAASTVVYFTNHYDLEIRKQSEDRAHRKGQVNTVTYIDLVVPKTTDEKILAALRKKQRIANLITKDTVKEWI